MRRLAALALACAVLPQGAGAKDGDNIEARAGDLKILHLWSLDPEGFLQAWAGPTPPHLPTASRTARNQPIQQFILYGNCAVDRDGNCRLSARVDITAPDGTPYGEPLIFMAMPPAPPVPRDVIGLTPNGIGLTIEDGEQLGEYRIDLALTDENAGVTARSTVHIEVVEAE
jgi:hypothetical protein